MADKRVIEQTASSVLYNDDWFLKDSVLEGTTKISAENLKELLTGDINDRVDKLLRNIIGPTYEWSASKTYKAGAIVYYEDSLYYCIADTATVGTFVPSEWRYVDLYENLTGKINSVIKMLAPYMQFSDISTIMPYSKGDIVRYQPTGTYKEKFYVAKEDLPEGIESYDPNDWDEYDTIGELIAGIMAEAGKVNDVKVDGTSVVTNKVAEIEIPVKDVEVDGTSVVNASGVAEITLPDVPVQDVQVKTDSTYDSVVDASGNAKIDLSSMTAYGEVPNLPQAIATFKDGADAPMKSLKVAIEPQQDLHGYDSPWVGGAGKNKFGGSYYNNYMSENNGVFTNTESDTQSVFRFIVQAFNGSDLIASSSQEVISSSGRYYVSITIPSSVTSLKIKHNGSSKDIGINCQFTATGTFTISINVTKANPSTVGGLEFKDVQIESGSQMTSFAPYSNICPISGWDEANVTRTGKNLFDKSNTVEGIWQSNGTFEENNLFITVYCEVKPNTTYSIQGISNWDNWRLCYFNSLNPTTFTYRDIVKSDKFTTDSDTVLISFSPALSTYGGGDGVQIEIGSTATTYEPYAGNTYNIDLDGTRYGGTLDVVSGVLTVDRGIKLVSNCTWYGSNGGFYTDAVLSSIQHGDGRFDHVISNVYKTENVGSITPLSDGGISVDASGYIQLKDSRYSTASDFKTNMGTTQLVYELATPLTIQLTPTAVKSLLGTNNIWADTGDINECIYQRDMNTTINDIIARLEALEG